MSKRSITIVLTIVTSATMALALVPSIRAEVKVETKVLAPSGQPPGTAGKPAAAPDGVATPGSAGKPAGAPAGVPTPGSVQPFSDGDLYYHAIPSGPAAGTAVRVIGTEDDTDYIVKAFKLRTKDIAAELASFLRTTVEKENGRVDVSVNTKSKEEFIVITAPIFQFEYLEQVINALDHDGTQFYEDGTAVGVYKLRNRLASDLGGLVNDALMSKDGNSYPDDTVNKVYYMDSPSYYNATVKYIEEFDVPPEMVRIDANIVEVEMNDDFNFGMALEAWKEGLPEAVDMQLDFAQSRDRADLNMNPGEWAQYAAQSISVQGMRPKAMANMINYLMRIGKAKVLSRPTVVAMNGERATIASLDKVSYKAYSTPDAPLNKQSDVGVALTITPTIGAQTITLAIDASVNSMVGWTSANDPIINTRSTTANVVLQDGELFSLSGLRKDVVTKQDERVPVLGSMPLFGYIFRHEIDVKTTSEIIVLLTPHKVTPKTSVLERERNLLDTTNAELTAPPPKPMDQFIDRVILNKKP